MLETVKYGKILVLNSKTSYQPLLSFNTFQCSRHVTGSVEIESCHKYTAVQKAGTATLNCPAHALRFYSCEDWPENTDDSM